MHITAGTITGNGPDFCPPETQTAAGPEIWIDLRARPPFSV